MTKQIFGLRLFSLLVPVALEVGCGNDTLPPEDMAAPVAVHNFQQINDEILQPSCAAFSVCHSPAGKNSANKLDLKGTADQAYAALLNVPAVNTQAKSEGLLLVKPCDADKSFLLMKLLLPESANDPKVGYGGHMPNSNSSLPKAQLDAIRDWIARGAHRTEAATVSGSTCTVEDMGTPDGG